MYPIYLFAVSAYHRLKGRFQMKMLATGATGKFGNHAVEA